MTNTKQAEVSDRELLELAAKAAGIKGSLIGSAAPSVLYEADGVAIYWNPLTSSADALDLAVKLRMVINAHKGMRAGDEDSPAMTVRVCREAIAALAQNAQGDAERDFTVDDAGYFHFTHAERARVPDACAARIKLAIEHGDANGWQTARTELLGILGSDYFAAAPSQPEDADHE